MSRVRGDTCTYKLCAPGGTDPADFAGRASWGLCHAWGSLAAQRSWPSRRQEHRHWPAASERQMLHTTASCKLTGDSRCDFTVLYKVNMHRCTVFADIVSWCKLWLLVSLIYLCKWNSSEGVLWTCLDDLSCHGRHFVSNQGYTVCLSWRWGAPPLQSETSHSIEDVCRRELEMNCGAVGVIYDCRQEGFLHWNVEDTSRGQEDVMTRKGTELTTDEYLTRKEYYRVGIAYSQLSQNLIPSGNPGWSKKSGWRCVFYSCILAYKGCKSNNMQQSWLC